MKQKEVKFRSVWRYISVILLTASIFVYPNNSFAILPSSTGLDILLSGNYNTDGARQFLELLRRQAADSVAYQPNLTRPQTTFENSLAKYRSFLDQIGGYGKSLGDLINIGQNLGTGNVSSQIGQIQNLVSTITSFKGGGNASDVLKAFDQLAILGVPGFNEANSEIISGISKLGNIDKGISEISKDASQILSVATELQNAQQTLQNTKLGGISSEAVRRAEDAVTQAQKKLNDVLGTTGEKATEVFNELNKVADTEAIENSFQTAGMQKEGQEQSVCDNPSPGVTGGGGGNGVPVIEQPGPLLDLTGKLVDFTSNIRTINKETCYKIEQLWKKEFELDPKIKEEAKKILSETKKELTKQFNEGRKPSNDLNAKKSFAPTISEFIKEEREAARNKHLDLLKNSNLPNEIKEPIEQALKAQNEIDKSNDAAYISRTKPTFDTKSFLQNSKKLNNTDFFNGLTEVANPKNNIFGQILLQSSERQRLQDEAEKNARDEFVAGQGIIGLKQCTNPITTEDGKTMCADGWQVKTPAKMFGDLQSSYYTDNYKQTAEAKDGVADQVVKESSKEDVQIVETASGAEGGSGFGGDTGGGYTGGTTGGGYTGGTTGGGYTGGGTTGGGFGLEDLINQITNITGGGESEQPSTPISIPLPIVTMDQTLENLGNGIFKTNVTWSADLAVSCRATNDWISYPGKATTTSQVLIPKNEKIELDDYENIQHPSAFSFYVGVTGNNRQLAAPIAQPLIISISKEGTGFKQTIKYTPNLTGVIDGDIFTIYINSDQMIAVSYTEGETEAQFAEKIRTAMNNVDPKTEKGKIYSGITKTMDGNYLNLTRSVTNIPSSASYEIACKNLTEKETVKKLTVQFFK